MRKRATWMGRWLATAAALGLQACGGGGGGGGTPVTPPPAAATAFTEVGVAAGLNQRQNQLATPSIEGAYSGGAAAGDFDGDGWPDLYVSRWDQPGTVYRNQHDGTFADLTAASGVSVPQHSSGAAWADIDNDGDLDLIVTEMGLSPAPLHLFINDGHGHFTDEGATRGLGSFRRGRSIAIGDYDRDGWLDLFVCEWDESGIAHSKLYHNLGAASPGHFADVTTRVGVAIDGLRIHSAAFADIDNDGWPDLLIGGDFGDSRLFVNNHDGTFADATSSAGVGVERFGMGMAVGDIDGNGTTDWFVTSIWRSGDPIGNRLYLGSGNRRFADVTDLWGVANGGWGWGAALIDRDNAGRPDLVMTSGSPLNPDGKSTNPYEQYYVAHTYYWSRNGSGYSDTTDAAGLANINGFGQAIVRLDYDHDGDLDLLLVNAGARPMLYRNNASNQNAWLRIDTVGVESNRDGIGARVTVGYGQGKSQEAEVMAGGNYLGQHEKTLHFGLGADPLNGVVDTIDVRWPSGHVQQLRSVAVNQRITITEPAFPVDADGDGIAYALDNCPSTWNPDQADMDHDGIGDACDDDIDGDGLSNADETNLYHTDPRNADTDGDGLPDGVEVNTTHTNPLLADTDGDGLWDGDEALIFHTDPRVPNVGLHFSAARQWDEDILNAIRRDVPHPPAHARSLYHLAAAMWDAWAAYDTTTSGVFVKEKQVAANPLAAREEALSYAAYRLLSSRYAHAVGAAASQAEFDRRMRTLGFDPAVTSTVGNTPAALGNRIAAAIIGAGLADGSNEANGYADTTGYSPVNAPLVVARSGAGTVADLNRWQPLALALSITQNGIVLPGKVQSIVGAQWGSVTPFALTRASPTALYSDPGPQPLLGGTASEDLQFRQAVNRVIRFSSQLTPDDGVAIDISPGALGNNTLGTNDGNGHATNPATGMPYAANRVLRGDFNRVLAEFWADGPASETPPGHWNVLANYVTDHTAPAAKRIGGTGNAVDDLEWDVKLYLALDGAVHDAAISAWGAKRKYDSVRPITMIRAMGALGQSSDATDKATYNAKGLLLEPGLVEVITAASSASGQRHYALRAHVGEIAILAWLGNPADPATQHSGTGWILAKDWLPYQKATFVTPAFPAYYSGHSTFSRSAAEVLASYTGSAWFPGGLATWTAPRNQYLQFELGPTTDVQLQWGTYYDAADQAGLSRLAGGIHVDADDFTGRRMGSAVGLGAWQKAQAYYNGLVP